MRQQPYPKFTCATQSPTLVTQEYRTTYRRERTGVELTPIALLIMAGAFSFGFLLTSLVMKVTGS